ncbi:MAG: transcription antitermination factor NusB [Candidatus Desulforudis sp.]|nr:transcription antitermination factor NusB [Desulforudis sp.]
MNRRRQRETALQVLFQAELAGISGDEAFTRTVGLFGLDPKALAFARELVFGVCTHQERIDQVIVRVSREWRLERIANVDRNIIRIALFELLFRTDIPANVAVNEAIELAKAYGTEDSGRFVNGILGKVIEQLEEYRPSIEN